MKTLLRLYIALLFLACAGVTAQAQAFSYPVVPDSLATTSQRASYLASHFFDRVNLSDSTLFTQSQNALDYIFLLSLLPMDSIERTIHTTASQLSANEDALSKWMWWLEHFLHDMESPLADNELYLTITNALISSSIDDVYKIRPRYQLPVIQRNRVGHEVEEIVLTDIRGDTIYLERLPDSLTLLFFHRQSCQHCRQVIGQMLQSEVLQELVERNRIIIVAIQTDCGPLRELSPNWICTIDSGQVENGQLFEAQQYPACYLLSADKKILLRQVSWERCEEFLRQACMPYKQ